MAKVLWLSDAGCDTGFARATHGIGERLIERYGHDISVLAVNYRGDPWPSHLDPSKTTPLKLYRPDILMGQDIYGKTRIVEMLAKVEPDVVVSLNDPQVMLQYLYQNDWDKQFILLQYRPIIWYAPIDGYNLPPTWSETLCKVTNVVAMSKHGQSQFPGSQLVYHGVDTDAFWPVSEKPIKTSTGLTLRTKKDCKRAFNFDEDAFVIGRVDTNSGRKDYGALVKALWPVMERHSDVVAHFHCVQDANVGVKLSAMLSRNPKVDPQRFYFPALHNSFEGWPQQDMNALMNAFDIYVTTSRGEGFGLGNAEALACGIPVVAQNISANTEVIGPGGILVEPQRLITVPAGHDNWLADIDGFTDAIERLYESRGMRRDLGEQGLAHVRSSFSWDDAAEKFDGFITALAADGEREPVAGAASA